MSAAQRDQVRPGAATGPRGRRSDRRPLRRCTIERRQTALSSARNGTRAQRSGGGTAAVRGWSRDPMDFVASRFGKTETSADHPEVRSIWSAVLDQQGRVVLGVMATGFPSISPWSKWSMPSGISQPASALSLAGLSTPTATRSVEALEYHGHGRAGVDQRASQGNRRDPRGSCCGIQPAQARVAQILIATGQRCSMTDSHRGPGRRRARDSPGSADRPRRRALRSAATQCFHRIPGAPQHCGSAPSRTTSPVQPMEVRR